MFLARLFSRAFIGAAAAFVLAAPALAQTVTTGAASSVGDISAVVSGTVNPGGVSGYVYFQLGTTTSYGAAYQAQPASITGPVDVAVSTTLTALQPSTTYHYRTACELAGIGPRYGADQTFTTAAASTPPTVGTPAVSALAASYVGVQCQVTGGSSEATVLFEYGTTTAYGAQRAAMSHVPPGSIASSASAVISDLQPGTTYHCRCKAINNEGTTLSADATFTTLPAPVITSWASTAITDLSATLNGTVDPQGGSYSLYAYYGPTTAYGQSRNGDFVSGTGPRACTVNPTDLLPSTTYHFCLVLVDGLNGRYYGPDQTFTTAAANTPPTPGVVSATTSAYHATTAQVLLSSLAAGSSTTTLTYEYGPTVSYGATAAYPEPVAAGTRQDFYFGLVSLSGLTPGTTYHVRAKATNAEGTVYSNDTTFTLPAGGTPITGTATGVTDLAATLNGTVNTHGLYLQVMFDFGTTTAYGGEVSVWAFQQNNTAAPFSVQPEGLAPGTTYHYRIKAANVYNAAEVFYGQDATFTTAAGATLPTVGSIYVSSVKATSVQVNCSPVFSGSSATTVVFEYGTTPDYGSAVASAPIPVNSTGSPTVTLTGLTPDTFYHVRAVATNAQGSATSVEWTFNTAPPLPPAIGILSTTQVRTTAAAVQAVNVSAGSSQATVMWDYGTTTAYGTTVPANTAAIIIPGITENTIPEGLTRRAAGLFTGLLPGTTYHYRCRATNGEGAIASADATFTTASGPLLSTYPASDVGDLTAVLHGEATASAGTLSFIAFEIGPTTAYGRIVDASPASIEADGTEFIIATVAGLLPDTTYHYRPRVQDEDENVFTGTDMTFTTGPAATPPTAVTQSPTALAAAGATLQADVQSGSSSATVVFEYGLTTAYGTQIIHAAPLAPSQSLTVSEPLPGLTPGATYHCRVIATNNQGSSTGADIAFTTPALPTVTTGAATGILATSARLAGSFLTAGGSYMPVFDYGETTAYGLTAAPGLVLTPGGGGGLGGGGIIIGGGGSPPQSIASATALVQPQKTYHFRLRLTDSYGNSYPGADGTFTTPAAVEVWRQRHFGSTADSGDAADLANPANDGLTNLMKYALAMNPLETGVAPPITVQEDAGASYLSISFTRNPDAVDMTYEVEAADSPAGPWTTTATLPPGGTGTGPGFIAEDVITITNFSGPPIIVSDLVHARDTVSLTAAPRRFLRLKVRR